MSGRTRRARDAGARPERAVVKRSEKAIQAAVLAFLAKIPGVVAWKSGAGAFRLFYKGKERFVRMGKRGVSDIVGWKRELVLIETGSGNFLTREQARFLAIEVKRPGAPFKPGQQEFLQQVSTAGGIAIVAHSVADVAAVLGLDVLGAHATGQSGALQRTRSAPAGLRGEEAEEPGSRQRGVGE